MPDANGYPTWEEMQKEAGYKTQAEAREERESRSRIDDYKDDDSYGWSGTTGDAKLDRKIEKIVNNNRLSDKEKRDMIDFLSPGGQQRSKQRIEDARTRAQFADEKANESRAKVNPNVDYTDEHGFTYDKWGRPID